MPQHKSSPQAQTPLEPKEMDHIYEEISDADSVYLEIADEIQRISIDTNKKSVRFNRSNHGAKQANSLNRGSILKKQQPIQISPGSQECMFSHSPSSASSSASSSFSSGQIYTSSSICSQSPSLTSTHSVAFNQMIDSFLSRFKTPPTTTTKKSKKSSKSLSTSSTSSSQSSLSVDSSLNSNSKASESANKATRLSVRVSNLTLEDLKLRQRMLCHQQQQQQQLQQSIVQYSWQTLQLMNNMNRNSCLVLGHCTSPVQV